MTEVIQDFQVDIARVNLHRIRGEYREAEQLALAILRHDPENLMGHTLMGEINAERGELEQSAEWYELALDLEPKSEPLLQKLDQVRTRIRERDAALTAEQLGLNQANGNLKLAAMAFVLLVIVVASVAFVLGQQNEGRHRAAVVRKTVDAPFAPGTASETIREPVPARGYPIPTPVTVPTVVQQDRLLIEHLAKGTDGARVLSAVVDPRTQGVTITFGYGTDDEPRKIAAELGKSAIGFAPEGSVILRGIKGGAVEFVANVDRAKLKETEEAGWNAPTGTTWVDHVLTDEWPKSTGTTTPDAPPSSP
ncbi:MAG: tetratricopeptide repeat protein [Fimbriimonas sp.]